MTSRTHLTLHRSAGFSLVEAMVGITLGIITVLIVTQTFATFETSKSTTTAGADAQENGLVAVTTVEQDARNAGAGFAESGAFDCTTYYTYLDTGSGTPGPIVGFGTAPVTIEDAAGTNSSDRITFRAGTDFLGIIPTYITDKMPDPSAELNVSRTYGFQDGDIILVAEVGGGNAGKCTLMQVTQVQSAALKLQHNPNNTPPVFNPNTPYKNDPNGDGNTSDAWPSHDTGAKIYNVGQVQSRVYSLDASLSLQLQDTPSLGAATTTYTLVRDIVGFQAQYGVANDSSEVVECWVSAVAAQTCTFTQPAAATKTENWNAPTAAMVRRIKAVRITVVARAGKREGTQVTTTAPTDPSTGVTIPGITSLTDWQNYRYKVYQSTILLRNVLWANL